MLLKDYKEKLLSNNIETIMINRKVKIRGEEVVILGIIKGEECNQLWTMRKNKYSSDSCDINDQNEFYEDDISTNREDLKNYIKQGEIYSHIHIREIQIQDEVINFSSSQSTRIRDLYGEQIHIVRYLIESDIIGKEWDDIDINDIRFGIYEQESELDGAVNLPTINYDKKIEITLKVEEETVEKLIEHPMTIKIGKYEKDNKIFYKDSDGKEQFFYLDEVIKYDIWKDTLEKIEESIDFIEEQYKEEYKQHALEDVANICPKDKDIVAIYYENSDNTQLRFLDKQYLESKPKYSSSCSVMMFYGEGEEGINGYNKNVDNICSVEKDFDGEIEIELFSKYERIPMEVKRFEISVKNNK